MQIDLLSGEPAPITLDYLQDPGHGWLRPPVLQLDRIVNRTNRTNRSRIPGTYFATGGAGSRLHACIRCGPAFGWDDMGTLDAPEHLPAGYWDSTSCRNARDMPVAAAVTVRRA